MAEARCLTDFDDLKMMDPTIVPDLSTIPLMSEDSNSSIFDLPSTGIEATDLSSLLSQFEEASQSFEGSTSQSIDGSTTSSLDGSTTPPVVQPEEPKVATPTVKSISAQLKVKGISPAITPPVTPPPEVLARIRAKRKRKLAIMLPTILPAKIKGSSTVSQSSVVASSKPECVNNNNNIATNNNTAVKSMLEAALREGRVEVDTGYFEYIPDHDYCVNSPKLSPKLDKSQQSLKDSGTSEVYADMMGQFVNEIVIEAGDTTVIDCDVKVESVDLEDGEVPETPPWNDATKPTPGTSVPKNSRTSQRNYRRRKDSPMHVDGGQYFNKIPAYFTTLSTSVKLPKENKSSENYNGIRHEDFIARDSSPSRKDPSLFDKLPAYYSCFTNSTKYDGHSEPTDNYNYESLDEYPSAKKPKRYRSSISRSRSRSRSYSRSRSRSCSRSRSRRRSFCRRRSYSSASGSSSSSSSSRSSSSSSSQSRSRSRSRSYSPRSRRSYSRSLSRGRSRYRSRSRSLSRRRGGRYSRSCSRSHSRSRSRCDSIERERRMRKDMREREKEMQIEERRIVYVGKIPDMYTRNELRRRFSRFGDIEEISVHFRENGDNYGFVTYNYTCDAYAAIEKGNDVPGEKRFDLCFGGRRQFCSNNYADLDHEMEVKEEFAPVSIGAPLDFDQLLRQAKQKIKRS